MCRSCLIVIYRLHVSHGRRSRNARLSEGPGHRSDVGGLRMKVGKLKTFAAVEHLGTPAARAEYLNIVLAESRVTCSA